MFELPNLEEKQIQAFLTIVKDRRQPIKEEAKNNLPELNTTLQQLSFSDQDSLLHRQRIIVDKIIEWVNNQQDKKEIQDRIRLLSQRINLDEVLQEDDDKETPNCDLETTIANLQIISNETLIQANQIVEKSQSLINNHES